MKHFRESVLLAWILALGLVLRVCAMLGRGLIDDEVAIALALEGSTSELLHSYGGQVTQPLYLLLAKASQELLGGALGTEAALRLPSVIFGTAAIVLVARLVRRLVPRKLGPGDLGPAPALLAALLLAVHPFHIFYSQMAVGYAVAGTLALGSVLAFLQLVETPSRRNIALFAAVTAAAIYCHLGVLGVILAEALMLPFVLRGTARGTLLRVLAALALGTALGLALYLPVLSSVLAFRAEWSGADSGLPSALVPFVLTSFAGGAGLRIYVYLGVGLLGLIALAARADRRRPLAVLVLWPAGVFLFYLVNRAAHPPWAFARFFFATLPAVIVGVAFGVDALRRGLLPSRSTWRRATAGALLVLLAATTLTRTAELAWGDKGTPWPELIEHLESRVPDDALLVSMPMRFNALRGFYHPRAEGVPTDTFDFRDSPLGVPLDRPVVFLVDLVPFTDPAWQADFTLTRFGDTTLLTRTHGPASEQRNLEDLQRITRAVLRYLNSRPPPRDWIYWKTDAEHQSLFDKRRLNRQYSVLLELIQKRLTGTRPSDREFKVQELYPPFGGLLVPLG